ncbi:hypothetical protein LY76DRAFT_334925 [Colletotrichum caudatum]|nr:hypothetical protein LY76DRAFT_334925 [Colletotrichum caudatum]
MGACKIDRRKSPLWLSQGVINSVCVCVFQSTFCLQALCHAMPHLGDTSGWMLVHTAAKAAKLSAPIMPRRRSGSVSAYPAAPMTPCRTTLLHTSGLRGERITCNPPRSCWGIQDVTMSLTETKHVGDLESEKHMQYQAFAGHHRPNYYSGPHWLGSGKADGIPYFPVGVVVCAGLEANFDPFGVGRLVDR